MSKPNSSATRKQGKSVILYAAKSKQIEEQIDIFSLFPTEVQIDQKFRTHTVQVTIQESGPHKVLLQSFLAHCSRDRTLLSSPSIHGSTIDFFCNAIEHNGLKN